jgi:hypothetical protein
MVTIIKLACIGQLISNRCLGRMIKASIQLMLTPFFDGLMELGVDLLHMGFQSGKTHAF